MKLTKIMLSLALIGIFSLVIAEDTTATETVVSVDDEIAAIQEAPAQERVRLMNQFKQRLMSMNKAERSEAIAQMQAAIQTTAVVTETMAHTTEMQMQTNTGLLQMQNMNQQQVASQIMSMPSNTPVSIAPVGGSVMSGSTQNFHMNMPMGR